MINTLKDLSGKMPISMLPDIINSNNESITEEFNNIYDSELNRLLKSVYTPTGEVKAHFGEFINLSAEYLTVKNPDSLKSAISPLLNDLIMQNKIISEQQDIINKLSITVTGLNT